MMNQAVTIYNRYGDDNPAKWGRHVLYDVHGRFGTGASLDTTGVSGGAIESVIKIPDNNRYCSPEAYKVADDKSALWTLQIGDAIYPGIGPEGDFTGHIKSAVPGCVLITGFVAHIYGSDLDHWSVTAK